MLYASLIASLVLLESRYILHGFFSQPFFTALILAATGHDPVFVFLTAAVVHLIYIDKKPSGASLFPEYPFAYFVISVSNGDRVYNTTSFLVSLLLIIFFAKLTALFIRRIRHFLEKHRDRCLFRNSLPDMPKAFLISFSILFIYSGSVIFIAEYLQNIFSIKDTEFIASFGYEMAGILLCLILTIKYAISSFRRKYA